MYSAYKLSKQDDNIQPWRTPFPIWNQSVVPCPVLTVASWPAYSFLKRQVRWSGMPISFRIFHSLCDQHSQRLWHSQWSRNRCFSGTLLLFWWFQWMLAIWSLVPLPFLKPPWTSGSSRFMYCWSLAWRILSITLLANCAIVWAFFGIAFLRDWNENWPVPVLWPLLSFPSLLAYWTQHFHSIILQDLAGSSAYVFQGLPCEKNMPRNPKI